MDTTQPSRLLLFAYRILAAAVFIIPFIWIPSVLFQFDFTKSLIAILAVAAIVVCVGISFLKGGWFVRPRGLIFYGALGVVLSAIISGFVSPTVYKSFIGQGFESTTVLAIVVFVAAAYATLTVIRKDSQAVGLMKALLASWVVVAIFQTLRLVFPNLIAGTFFGHPTSGVLGSWYDLGIFFALSLVITLVSLVLPSARKTIFHKIVFVVSLLFLAIINAPFIWYALILISLIVLLVSSRIKKSDAAANISSDVPSEKGIVARVLSGSIFWPLLVLVVAVVFSVIGTTITRPITTNLFNFAPEEISVNRNAIRLPWQMTLEMAPAVYKADPVFGPGPNRFTYEFLLHKPASVNTTPQWGIEFTSGYGYVPTVMLTQGALGTIAWLVLLVGVLLLIIKAFRMIGDSTPERKVILTTVATANILLWVSMVIFTPAYPMIFVSFVMLGVLAAVTQSAAGVVMAGSKTFGSIINGVAAVVVLVFVVAGLWTTKKYVGAVYFQSGVEDLKVNNVDSAHAKFNKALWYGDYYDIYYQALAQTALMKARAKFGSTDKPDATLVDAIRQDLTDAVNMAKAAVEKDPTNYYNHITEARISASLVPLQIPNSRENAERAYSEAIKQNPSNPGVLLELAQFEANIGNAKDAKSLLTAALQMKNNYTEAAYYYSQISLSEGDTKGAAEALSAAINMTPTNPFLYFELGRIAYLTKDYNAALQILAKAIELDEQYSDARYFAGLSLSKLGKVAEATRQFEIIEQLNPDNDQVKSILKNLRAGRAPLTGIADGESTPALKEVPEETISTKKSPTSTATSTGR
ncbi:MAG: tetratricopeptide repeat protein [Patescibacteria group bacterium]